jgi:DNA-binding NarL/FixJ family response regulator
MTGSMKYPALDFIEPLELSSRKINVWLFSSQPLFRLGLRQALAKADGLCVSGDSGLNEKRLILLELMPPDVVIVDLEPDIFEAAELIKRVHRSVPEARIITLSSDPHSECVEEIAKSRGALSTNKDIGAEKICEMVRSTCASSFEPRDDFFCRASESGVPPRPSGKMPEKKSSRLSAREIEIMTAIAGGYANKQIASRLGISERTVKNHVTSIFKKLGVNARVEALIKALKSGLITLGNEYQG